MSDAPQHNDLFRMVHETYQKLGFDNRTGPTHLDPDEKRFRLVGMREELDEYEDAESLEDELDALVDLVVWALGTAERHGFHLFNEAFRRVDRANRQKIPGTTERAGGTHETDLYKPPGWTAPDLRDLVDRTRTAGHPHPFPEPELPVMPMLRRANDLCVRKSQDYGAQDHAKAEYFPYGAVGYLQMLFTKFKRLESATIRDGAQLFDSAVDSCLDLINYASFFAQWLEDREVESGRILQADLDECIRTMGAQGPSVFIGNPDQVAAVRRTCEEIEDLSTPLSLERLADLEDRFIDCDDLDLMDELARRHGTHEVDA